jgi:hypothetical protein
MKNLTEYKTHTDAMLGAINSPDIFPDSDELAITGTLTCPTCSDKAWLILPNESVQAFLNGAHAQTAFPFMNADQRERFITGICPPCWKKMFSED